MQCPRSCPGAATHRTTLQGTPLVPINAHPCPAGHPALRMPPPRALHLRHSGPDDQQPAEMSSEAGSATTTLPMQPRQHPHQYQRSVGDAMWTVWSGTQQFAGNVLSSWSSREASVDNVDNAAQSSLPSTSGRARLLKDAAESGKTVRVVSVHSWHGWLPSSLACPHVAINRLTVPMRPSQHPTWSHSSSLWVSWKLVTFACCPTCAD